MTTSSPPPAPPIRPSEPWFRLQLSPFLSHLYGQIRPCRRYFPRFAAVATVESACLYDAVRLMAFLPWLLIAARAAAALVMAIALAARALDDGLVLWLFVVAFVSDYFDGVIARALKVVTRSLRQADSVVDTIFYLVLAAATWSLHPEVLRRHATALGICLGTLSAWYLLDLFRWRAAAGFHSFSAKLFAAALGVWAVVQYGCGGGGPWLVVACVAGTLSHLEGIAISLVLRQHVADVPTLLHALRLRAGRDLGNR